MEPAPIRYKNPGAMWGSPLAKKWGASSVHVLNDGLGQGNNIAIFPTDVQGIEAQLDLWRTSDNYRNKSFADAIRIWSGGNDVEDYISFVTKRVPGMTRDTTMNDNFWHSSMAVPFLKAQAWHEAGKPYPASDAEWNEAQQRVMGDTKVETTSIADASVAPPWLVNAQELVGLKEIVGSEHEEKILAFFPEVGHPEIHDDETPWCAAFVGAMLERSGIRSTRELNARSYLDWGDELNVPKYGCVAVFRRGDSDWQGHVAFYVGETATHIRHLGGNQGNSVSISSTPKDRLLGYRWPKGVAKTSPVKDVVKKGAVIAAGGGGGAAISEGVKHGLSVFDWVMIGGGVIVLAVAVYFIYKYGKQWLEHRRIAVMGAEPITTHLVPASTKLLVTAPKRRKARKVVKKRRVTHTARKRKFMKRKSRR